MIIYNDRPTLIQPIIAANYIDYSYFQCFTGGAESGTHKADHDYEPLVCILFMILPHSIHLLVQYFHHTGQSSPCQSMLIVVGVE